MVQLTNVPFSYYVNLSKEMQTDHSVYVNPWLEKYFPVNYFFKTIKDDFTWQTDRLAWILKVTVISSREINERAFSVFKTKA